MKCKELGKYLPGAADWQVACGPSPQWGHEHSMVLSAMASFLLNISWVLSSVKGVVSVLAVQGLLHLHASHQAALGGHAVTPSSAVMYNTTPTTLATSLPTPSSLSGTLLPQALCLPGRKSTTILPHRGQSRLPVSCVCPGCTALLTAMCVLVGTCLPPAPSPSLSPSPLSLRSSQFLRPYHVLHAVLTAETMIKAN